MAIDEGNQMGLLFLKNAMCHTYLLQRYRENTIIASCVPIRNMILEI